MNYKLQKLNCSALKLITFYLIFQEDDEYQPPLPSQPPPVAPADSKHQSLEEHVVEVKEVSLGVLFILSVIPQMPL